MIVSRKKYLELLNDANELAHHVIKLRLEVATLKLNNAVRSVDDVLASRSPTRQFDNDDIARLLRLCHPDKHGNSEAANEMTKKLLSMRSGK